MKATELEDTRSRRTGNAGAVCIIILSHGYCLRVNILHVQMVHFFLISNIPKSLYILFISLKIMLLFNTQLNKENAL